MQIVDTCPAEAGMVRFWLAAAAAIVCSNPGPGEIDEYLTNAKCMVTSLIKPSQYTQFGQVSRWSCRSLVKHVFSASIPDVTADRKIDYLQEGLPFLPNEDDTYIIHALPAAARIESASFKDMRNAKIVWMQAPNGLVYKAGALDKLDRIHVLVLVNVEPNGLPWKLKHLVLRTSDGKDVYRRLQPSWFRGGSQLTHLTASQNELDGLPEWLFNNTPSIKYIDFSHNQLRSLPRNVFVPLLNLQTLILSENQLRLCDMAALSPVTLMKDLRLTSNPIGDFCTEGQLSMLYTQLYVLRLDLDNTNITHLCYDWANGMLRLETLNARRNRVSRLSCDDLAIARGKTWSEFHLHLAGNPITRVDCNQTQFERLSAGPAVSQKLYLRLPLTIRCECDGDWSRFKQLLDEKKLQVWYKLKLEPECEQKYDKCTPKSVDGLNSTVKTVEGSNSTIND